MSEIIAEAEMQVAMKNLEHVLGVPVHSIKVTKIDTVKPSGLLEPWEPLASFAVEGYAGSFSLVGTLLDDPHDGCTYEVAILTDTGYQVDPNKVNESYHVPDKETTIREVYRSFAAPFVAKMANNKTPEQFAAWVEECQRREREGDDS